MPATPMYLPRLGALFMSFAFGVIGGSVGLNALIKRNQTQSRLFREIPPGPEITVDTTNVFDSGTVITTVCALIAVISFALLLWTASVRNVSNGRMHSLHSSLHRTLVHQAAVLAFCAVWLFATLIPFEIFFANDSVGISGTLFGLPIPQNTINQIASSLGFHIKYRDYNFLRLVAILPWFTFLFASIAAVVLFMASRRWSTMQGQSTLTDKSVHA